jgi:hypothetical protein
MQSKYGADIMTHPEAPETVKQAWQSTYFCAQPEKLKSLVCPGEVPSSCCCMVDAWCETAMVKYGVQPGVTYGAMSQQHREQWRQEYFCEHSLNRSRVSCNAQLPSLALNRKELQLNRGEVIVPEPTRETPMSTLLDSTESIVHYRLATAQGLCLDFGGGLLEPVLQDCIVSAGSGVSTSWQFSWDQASHAQLRPSNSPADCLGVGSGNSVEISTSLCDSDESKWQLSVNRKSAGVLYELKSVSDNNNCLLPDASGPITVGPCLADSAVWRLEYASTPAVPPVDAVDCFEKFVGWKSNMLQPLAVSVTAQSISAAAKLCSGDRACVAFTHNDKAFTLQQASRQAKSALVWSAAGTEDADSVIDNNLKSHTSILSVQDDTVFLAIELEKLQLIEVVRIFIASDESCSAGTAQLQLLYSQDSGQLDQRTFKPVHALRGNLAGHELWTAKAGPLGTLDSASVRDGKWQAAQFTPVNATAVGLAVWGGKVPLCVAELVAYGPSERLWGTKEHGVNTYMRTACKSTWSLLDPL